MKKDVLVRSSANLKSFSNGRFTFLIYLQLITWISKLLFFFSHTHTNSVFSSEIPFSIVSVLFQNFLSYQTPIAKTPFWFLETQGSTIDSIYGLLLLKSTTGSYRYNSFSKSFISSSIIKELQKYVIARKIDFTLSPINKPLIPHLIITNSTPIWLENLDPAKTLVCFE